MPSSRLAKQILYGLLYFVVFFGIIGGIYFGLLRSPASCFDNRQNQAEEGVDCGGSCEPCEIRKLAPLTARTVKVLPTAQGVTLFAEVRNENPTFGAVSLTYVFEVLDATGRSIKTISGESFIYPSEIKYFVELAAGISLDEARRANFRIEGAKWERREEFAAPTLLFREVRHEIRADGSLATLGVIVNGETVPFRRLVVGALYADQFGEIVGASKTELRDLTPFEERFFQITHLALPGADLKQTKLYYEGKRE